MRNAIGGTLLIVYVSLLAIGVFHEDWSSSQVGKDLLGDLTKVFGVVISFYFATSATAQVLTAREDRLAKSEPEP